MLTYQVSRKDTGNIKLFGRLSKYLLPVLMTVLLLFLPNAIQSKEKDNSIQLAILLDTSSSMDGLIEQAKTQLWKIVNELARTKKEGESVNIEVALYEYGKSSIPQNEGYIRMLVPLSSDLDKISDELFRLQTNGGDEYCGKVIQSAVEGLLWKKSNDMLKIIVIAGNEPFTQGDVDYRKSCKTAIEKGIIVNTIYCGDYDEGLNTNWKDGADLADGKYMNINQNEQIVHIKTPQDDELAQLGMELNKTYLAYGVIGNEKKELQLAQDENSASLSPSVMAERAVTKASGQYRNASWDLVDAEEEGVVDVADLDESLLPQELKDLDKTERKEYIDKLRKDRENIQERINQLNEERRKYIADQLVENNTNTLDAAILKAISAQAKAKGYKSE